MKHFLVFLGARLVTDLFRFAFGGEFIAQAFAIKTLIGISGVSIWGVLISK